MYLISPTKVLVGSFFWFLTETLHMLFDFTLRVTHSTENQADLKQGMKDQIPARHAGLGCQRPLQCCMATRTCIEN